MSGDTQAGNERLFVAARVTAPALGMFESWVADLKAAIGEDQPRWLPSGLWHLTLRFIGSCDQRPAIQTALDEVIQGPMLTADAHCVGPFPNSRPSVIAVQMLAGDRLLSLAANIEQALCGCGLKPEPRPFRAHISLARVKRGSQRDWPTIAVSGSLSFEQVVLYRSELTSSGARYTPLQQWILTRNELNDLDSYRRT